MKKPSLIVCLDPGTYKCGYVEYLPDGELHFGAISHLSWSKVRANIQSLVKTYSDMVVCSEEMIFYSHLPGSAKIMPTTMKEIGRIIQICDDHDIPFKEMIRKDIIEKLTGEKVTRKKKVSKTDMQDCVQKLLKLDKPIRPQHANDALCVGLAFYPPKKT